MLVMASALALASPAFAEENTNEAWQSLKQDVFGDRQIADAGDKIVMQAPYRAEDAALTPISITMPADFAVNVSKLTLIVDKNPSPIVGVFSYGPAAGNSERSLSTRIRVDRYSDVRAIAETSDGKLFMISKFVKASGGCSAPAGADLEAAKKMMGKMKIKTAIGKNTDGLTQKAQVMIKHPNNSGLAMDQLTGLYVPAHYITKISVKTGGKLIFNMEGGISISENPNLRFSYNGDPSDVMEVSAEDSEGGKFVGRSKPSQS